MSDETQTNPVEAVIEEYFDWEEKLVTVNAVVSTLESLTHYCVLRQGALVNELTHLDPEQFPTPVEVFEATEDRARRIKAPDVKAESFFQVIINACAVLAGLVGGKQFVGTRDELLANLYEVINSAYLNGEDDQ